MFRQKNPTVNIVGPTESMTLIKQAALLDKYSEFIGDYARSGILDANTLKEIGESLGVNAILQGEVFNIEQVDGDYNRKVGSTSLTVRYFLMGGSEQRHKINGNTVRISTAALSDYFESSTLDTNFPP
jgi:hypothetical protein